MKKRQDPDPPKPAGAPAYMGQFASLMTILLAFFIVMLTLGQNRVAQFKEGVGQIRNMIGLQGGSGVLDFWRSMRHPPVPKVVSADKEEREDAMLVGYQMGARDAFSISSDSLSHIDFENPNRYLRLNTSIKFEEGQLRLQRETQSSLDHITTLLYSIDGYRVDVEVWGDNHTTPRHLAARRAVWIARYLVEHARLSPERVRSMGLLRNMDETTDDDEIMPEVTFLLRRMKEQ